MNNPMRSPSQADGSEGGNLRRAHRKEGRNEAVNYALMVTLAVGIYFAGTEWAIQWVRYFRTNTAATLTPVSPQPAVANTPSQVQPGLSPQQQQQITLQQNQQRILAESLTAMALKGRK